MAAAKVSGFFTSLKKEVLTIGQTKTKDSSFESAKTNYDAFVFAVQTLKAHVDAWHNGAKAMATGAEHVGNDFKNAMQNVSGHPFANLANDGKTVQNAVYKCWEGCEKQLESTANAHFKELNTLFSQLKEKMKAREAARLDFDYRTGQVKSAQESRDKLIAKGKAESPKDSEKRVVAEKKLEDSTATWNNLNSEVINALTHLHDNRQALLGNIYIEFLAVQKAFAQGMAKNIDTLVVPAIPPAAAWNIHPGAHSTLGDAKAAPEFSDVSLRGGASAAPPSYATLPPGGGAHNKPSAQAQQIERQNAAAAAIMASMPPSGEGVDINANFAADDEAAMRGGKS